MEKEKKVSIEATLGTSKDATDQPATAPPLTPTLHSAGAILTSPVILTLGKGGKKKRKRYSRGTKSSQRFLYGLSKAGYRVSDSFTSGLNLFVKRSNRSAKKKRDGLTRDSIRNASRGLGRGIRTLSRVPDDLTRRGGTRFIWRTFRVLNPLGN